MSASANSLPAAVMQEMIEDQYSKKFRRFESALDYMKNPISLAEQTKRLEMSIFEQRDVSNILKKLHSQYLTKAQ